MKFICSKEQLDQQLQHVSRIIIVRYNSAVLSNLLLETDEKIVRISGTDLEMTVTTYIDAEVQQEGAFTVPAKVFQDFIHQNPDEKIEIKLQSNEIWCKSKKVEAHIPGIEPEEYPALPKIQEKHRLVLPATQFMDAMRQVVIACATDLARPTLTGIHMDFSGGTATF